MSSPYTLVTRQQLTRSETMSENICINNHTTKDNTIIEAYYNKANVPTIRIVDECGEVISIRKYESTDACLKAFRNAIISVN